LSKRTDPSGTVDLSDFAGGKTPVVRGPDVNVTASPYPNAPAPKADPSVSPDANFADFSGLGGKVPSVIANAAAGADTKPVLAEPDQRDGIAQDPKFW
jgi:hypothetical protein